MRCQNAYQNAQPTETTALDALVAAMKALLGGLGLPCINFAPFFALAVLPLKTVGLLLLLFVADTPAGSFAHGCTSAVLAYSPVYQYISSQAQQQ